MVNPKHIQLIGEKHVMRYLRGALDYGLRYACQMVRLYYMGSQNQIGKEAIKIERELQDVVLFWDQA